MGVTQSLPNVGKLFINTSLAKLFNRSNVKLGLGCMPYYSRSWGRLSKQLSAYKVCLFFLENHAIKFQKNYFAFMERGHLVKKYPLGRKIWLLVKFLKCSNIIYHSIAKLMLIKNNFSFRV